MRPKVSYVMLNRVLTCEEYLKYLWERHQHSIDDIRIPFGVLMDMVKYRDGNAGTYWYGINLPSHIKENRLYKQVRADILSNDRAITEFALGKKRKVFDNKLFFIISGEYYCSQIHDVGVVDSELAISTENCGEKLPLRKLRKNEFIVSVSKEDI